MKPSRTQSAIPLIRIFTGICLLALLAFGVPPAQAQQIQVTSADPPSGAQGTVNLNVRIKGKGFKQGSVASFLVTGTENPGGIVVNNTQFVSSTELIANIDIADTAELANFDIVVYSNGRTGKGIELFAVTAKGSGGGNSSCPALTPRLTSPTNCTATSPGCFDISFGGTGYVLTDTSGPFGVTGDMDWGREVAILPDGKMLVVGWSRKPDNSGDETALVRYNPDGTLDPTFGTNGIARLAKDHPADMALQPDGKILLVGFGFRFSVARLNPDGSLDTSFGSGGETASLVFGKGPHASGTAQAVAVQGDGKILVAGYGGTTRWAIARFNSNGSLDTTFANGGKLELNATGGTGWAIAFQTVLVGGQPVERILVGGSSKPGPGQSTAFTVMRFTMSGAVDTSFGPSGNGMVQKDVCSEADTVKRLGVDADGNIIVAGMVQIGTTATNYANHNPALARFTANGLPDNTFGEGIPQRPGTTVVEVIGGYDTQWGFAIQGDGKILVSGFADATDSTRNYIYLARFDPAGTLDTTFGTGGLVAIDASDVADNFGHRLALQADGKIVVVGSAAANNTFNFVVMRIWH